MHCAMNPECMVLNLSPYRYLTETCNTGHCIQPKTYISAIYSVRQREQSSMQNNFQHIHETAS